MSGKCLRCFRPMETCYCRYITTIRSGVKFVFLMHPKEAYKQRTGTGRLAHLSLEDSEILVGIDFTENRRLKALLNDPQFFPAVLYPGEDAWCVSEPEGAAAIKAALTPTEKVPESGDNRENLKDREQRKTLLVVVVDGTWPCAKKMLRLSPNVTALQKISFSAGYRSEYQFKKEPQEDYLSTIESCYYLLREMQQAELCARTDIEGLMNVFRRMVRFQLQSQEDRIKAGIPDRYQAAGSIRAKKREARQAKENCK